MKATSMEDDLNQRRPQWTMTSMEDKLNGRRPQQKRTLMEDDIKRRTPLLKSILILNWSQPQWKSDRKQMALVCLASQFCTCTSLFYPFLLEYFHTFEGAPKSSPKINFRPYFLQCDWVKPKWAALDSHIIYVLTGLFILINGFIFVIQVNSSSFIAKDWSTPFKET